MRIFTSRHFSALSSHFRSKPASLSAKNVGGRSCERKRGKEEEIGRERETVSSLKLDRLAGTERMRLIHADEL